MMTTMIDTAYVIWATLGFTTAAFALIISLALAASDSEEGPGINRPGWSWVQTFMIAVMIVCMIGAAASVHGAARECSTDATAEAK